MDGKLKILPLDVDKDALGEVDCGMLPRIPHFILCCGKVRAGKSVMACNLYCRGEPFYKDKFDVKVLLCPSAYSDVNYKKVLKDFDYVFEEINETLIEELLKMINGDTSENKWLFVLDDVVGSIKQNKTGKVDLLSMLATKYRHMCNDEKKEGKLSIFIATQYFKFLTPILRSNASAYLIMGHFGGKELKAMSDELDVFGGSEKEFVNIFKKSRKNERDFLYLDASNLKAYRNFDEMLFSEEDLLHKNEE